MSYSPSTTTSPPALAPSTTTPPKPSLPPSQPTTFVFPREYNFPPFFTPQLISTTSHAQSLKWSSLIQSYCRHQRIWRLSLVDAIETELFYNRRIGKRLAIADAREMVEFMRREGRAEWVGRTGGGGLEEGRSTAWIWWRRPEEWARVIAEWVEETGQKNTVLTLYELTKSEATLSQEFHGMDPELLQKALSILVKRGKAQVFGQEDQGVKFF